MPLNELKEYLHLLICSQGRFIFFNKIIMLRLSQWSFTEYFLLCFSDNQKLNKVASENQIYAPDSSL